MKAHSIAVLALLLAVAGPISQARAADPLLQPSIVPFSTAPSSMIDIDGVAYYGSLKTPPPYFGQSVALFNFFKYMDRDGYDIRSKQEALKKETEFYIESVEDLGKITIPRLKNTTQAQLDAIGPASALKEIRGYGDTYAHVQAALLAEQKAWKHVDEAMKEVDADSLLILKIDLTAEREDLNKQKKEIFDKAKAAAAKAGVLPKIINLASTAITNPLKIQDELQKMGVEFAIGAATDMLADALMNNVLIENRETMAAIDKRLAEIDKTIPGRTDVEKKRLAAKRDRLDAARLEVLQAGVQRFLAKVEAIDKIDDLAAMERNARQRGSKLNVFEAVQSYYEEMRMSERRIRLAANDYLTALDFGAPGQAPAIMKGIDQDVAYVRTRRDAQDGGDAETLRWLRLANFTGGYMSKQAKWYANERQRVQGILASLETGKHLDFLQSSMATLQLKAGSTR